MSSSNVTAPIMRRSLSRIGVERRRKARLAPSTAHGTTAAALSEATGRSDRSTSATAPATRASRATWSIGLPTVSRPGPNSGSAAALVRSTRPSASVTITGS